MGFHCSLEIFYPGLPPTLTLGNLHAFSEAVGRSGLTKSAGAGSVELRFGDAAQAYADTLGTQGDLLDAVNDFYNAPRHHVARGAGGNMDLWPDVQHAERAINWASLKLGGLRSETAPELAAADARDDSCWFILQELSIHAGPVCPDVLGMDDEDFACLGFFKVSLWGMGYFGYRPPIGDHVHRLVASPTVQTLLKCCREHFHVPSEPTRLDQIRKALGERFLNGGTYREGDWIVSFSENG